MAKLEELLQRNQRWAAQALARDPDFFTQLSGQQTPQYLWIGCADSRVPANQVVDMAPGEIFVHRNVANVVVHSDLNCLSTIQFSVEVLKVRHIIVCGHYGCGGVKAALTGARIGLADNWINHIGDVIARHDGVLAPIGDEEARLRAACELNVIEQMLNVCRTTPVRDAWSKGQPLTVHAWIYGLDDGLVKELGFGADGPDGLMADYDDAIAAVAARAGGDA
ncbi:carbonate dehydratase [Luteimonas vadosa]|uniref:carbonic anhydrase n=1 Tax=Luteimonas vadosa TaxID=1165507 RepID=A0ABP9E165_9GAMM